MTATLFNITAEQLAATDHGIDRFRSQFYDILRDAEWQYIWRVFTIDVAEQVERLIRSVFTDHIIEIEWDSDIWDETQIVIKIKLDCDIEQAHELYNSFTTSFVSMLPFSVRRTIAFDVRMDEGK